MNALKSYDILSNLIEYLDQRELALENFRLMLKREIYVNNNLKNTLESYDEVTETFTNIKGFFWHKAESVPPEGI